MSLPATVRAFIALTPPEQAISHLTQIHNETAARLRVRSLRWEQPYKWHITLVFMEAIPETEMANVRDRLTTACASIEPIALRIEGFGAFPNLTRPRLLWAGVQGDLEALERLNVVVHGAASPFGQAHEHRSFTPRLTMARIKAPTSHELRRINDVWSQMPITPLGEWVADSVEVFQSRLLAEGSIYERLAAIPLGTV